MPDQEFVSVSVPVPVFVRVWLPLTVPPYVVLVLLVPTVKPPPSVRLPPSMPPPSSEPSDIAADVVIAAVGRLATVSLLPIAPVPKALAPLPVSVPLETTIGPKKLLPVFDSVSVLPLSLVMPPTPVIAPLSV